MIELIRWPSGNRRVCDSTSLAGLLFPGNVPQVDAPPASVSTHPSPHVAFAHDGAFLVRPQAGLAALLGVLDAEPEVAAVGPVTDLGPGPQAVELGLAHAHVHEVHYLAGTFLLVRREIVDLAGMPEASLGPVAFLDYAIRIREAGGRLACCRSVLAVDPDAAASIRVLSDAASPARRQLAEMWGEARVAALFGPVGAGAARVLVAIPVYGAVDPDAYASHLIELAREARTSERSGLSFEIVVFKRSNLVEARNQAARKAVHDGFTHLFFLDDDMLVPPGALHRLVAHGCDVVSGLCFLRRPPHRPAMFIDPRRPGGVCANIRSWPRDRLIEVDATGCACLLIRTDVLRRIEARAPGEPWFAFGAARPGEGPVGEDLFFAKRARDAGFQIFVDTALEFGHLGPRTVYGAGTVDLAARTDADPPGIDYASYAAASALARQAVVVDAVGGA